MDYEERDPICSLFRLDANGAVARLDDGIICSNGPCWSLDGRTLYFADTGKNEIWAYDYDLTSGNATNRRVFASFPAHRLKGLPDGATVDADGFLWSVSVYEGKLVRFSPDGKLDRVVGLPVESTTSLSFCGPNLDIAFVTSMARAVKGVKPKEREAGALFAVHGLEHAVFGLNRRRGFPNRIGSDSTCWLGGGQQECQSRIRKTCVSA
jgi:sugar lactone lactonase YvrE